MLAFFVAPALAKAPVWANPINDPSRFVVLPDYASAAVGDKETGLVWELQPDLSNPVEVEVAVGYCLNRVVGGRKGWRLPTAEELASLVDPTQASPALPAGHPFVGITGQFWSLSNIYSSTNQYYVDLDSGAVSHTTYSAPKNVWCVRGGASPIPY